MSDEVKSLSEKLDLINNNLVFIYNEFKKRDQDAHRLMVDIDHKFHDIGKMLGQELFLSKMPSFKLQTSFPVAINSDDHKFPRGTSADNTRWPRFRQTCERLFGTNLTLLDLGCSGGGLVADFIFAGYPAVGVEGSDFSRLIARSEWARLPQFLFTADITQPFKVTSGNEAAQHQFSIVSLWEVLEHIPEHLITGLLENIYSHLTPSGYCVASVAQFPDSDPVTGAVWHVTLKPREWWYAKFITAGFEVVEGVFDVTDFPRGNGTFGPDYNPNSRPEDGFHLVVRKR